MVCLWSLLIQPPAAVCNGQETLWTCLTWSSQGRWLRQEQRGLSFNPSIWALVSVVDRFWFLPGSACFNQLGDEPWAGRAGAEQVQSCFLPCREPDGQLIVPSLSKTWPSLLLTSQFCCCAAKLGYKKMRTAGTSLSIWTSLSHNLVSLVSNLEMVPSLFLFSQKKKNTWCLTGIKTSWSELGHTAC